MGALSNKSGFKIMSFTSDKASPILLKEFSKVYRIFFQLIYLIIEQDDPEIGPALTS